MNFARLLRRRLPALALIPVLLTGFWTSQPGSTGPASLVIQIRAGDEVRGTTRPAFQADDHRAFAPPTGEMMSEQKAMRGTAPAHGGIGALQQGCETWSRAKDGARPLKPGGQRVQCRAFMGPHQGHCLIEVAHSPANSWSSPCQQRIVAVAARSSESTSGKC